MKQITFLFLWLSLMAHSQTPPVVNFDSELPWQGFMNVFQTPANGGGFVLTVPGVWQT